MYFIPFQEKNDSLLYIVKETRSTDITFVERVSSLTYVTSLW